MPTTKKSQPPAPLTEHVRLPVDQLLLDKENPRLAYGETASLTQKELLRRLWDEMAVDEIVLSIAENGFFPEEKLFVIPQKLSEPETPTKKYIVVEGNRRLAAVRILLDDKVRHELKATDLPELSVDAKERLQRLPVSVYRNRKDLWQYFGFRHINGPKPWDPYSKADYIAEVHEHYNVPLEDIARSIGDRHATVVRLYRGLKLLEQAETTGVFNREDSVRPRFALSHLYTAAAQPEFQKLLGIVDDGSLKQNPVPKKNLPQLRELMLWLYGSKSAGINPLIETQHPDLNRLREIISTRQGLAALRAGYALERAYEISIGDVRRFREALTRAKEELQQAKATVTTGYAGEPDLLQTMEAILAYAESLKSEMTSKLKPASAPAH